MRKKKERLNRLKRRQARVVRELKRALVSVAELAALRACSDKRCSRRSCSAVCPYGADRVSRNHQRCAADLLSSEKKELFVVRLWRPKWRRARGALKTAKLNTLRKLSREALDRIGDPTTLAVGTIRAAPFALANEKSDIEVGWKLELVQIVTADKLATLNDAFSHSKSLESRCEIEPVKDLQKTLKRIFRPEFGFGWKRATFGETISALRSEYWAWLFGLRPTELVVRYGCGRQFHCLQKTLRIKRSKPKKPRPNPVWLAPYQFGSDTRERRDWEKFVLEQNKRRSK